MKHTGVCTRMARRRRPVNCALSCVIRLTATLLVAGVACTYSGKLSDSYSGMMNCRTEARFR